MPTSQRSAEGPQQTSVDEKPSTGKGASSTQVNAVIGATKQDTELWQCVIRMVKHDLARETDAHRLENIGAVLDFIQEHGYPDGNRCEEGNPEFCIWVMDGNVKCQMRSDFYSDPRWNLPPPGFKGRPNEGYSVVSSIQ